MFCSLFSLDTYLFLIVSVYSYTYTYLLIVYDYNSTLLYIQLHCLSVFIHLYYFLAILYALVIFL